MIAKCYSAGIQIGLLKLLGYTLQIHVGYVEAGLLKKLQ